LGPLQFGFHLVRHCIVHITGRSNRPCSTALHDKILANRVLAPHRAP
jgi:hypothetical protein